MSQWVLKNTCKCLPIVLITINIKLQVHKRFKLVLLEITLRKQNHHVCDISRKYVRILLCMQGVLLLRQY